MLRKAISIAFLAVLVLAVNYYVKMLGVLKHHYKHYPGTCKKINGRFPGSEDFQVTSDGLAFITSGLYLGPASDAVNDFITTGRIFLFDFSKPDAGILDLKIRQSKGFNPKLFRPHGISLLEDKAKGEHLLYVVTHPPKQADRVEKFRYLPETKELVHVKSFQSDLFHTTNDLAVVEEDLFYISNYAYATTSRLLGHLELFLPLPLGSVLLHDGKGAKVVVPNVHGPNGVLLSPDRKFLYVNYPHEEKMDVYSRNPKDNSLTLTQSAQLGTAADNSHLSESGNAVITGCHPIGHKILAHMSDPGNKKADSQVLHMPLKKGKVVENDITELFYDKGELISGSSIAAVYKGHMLVGSVLNNLVLCDMNGPTTK